VLPNIAQLIKPFLKDRKPNEIEKIWKRLVDKKIIELGGENFQLSAKGKMLLKEIQFHEIEIKKPSKWDGIWRLVSYDVPQIQNTDRDSFRLTLKRWGFYQIQASLWVYPYECKEEVAVAAEFFNIAPFVIVMLTDVLPNEELVEDFFSL
jgi:DNA-binding transcriptional regulator PaaX